MRISSARPTAGLGRRRRRSFERVAPHCDSTVNLHDALHVVDGDALIAIWSIDARGH